MRRDASGLGTLVGEECDLALGARGFDFSNPYAVFCHSCQEREIDTAKGTAALASLPQVFNGPGIRTVHVLRDRAHSLENERRVNWKEAKMEKHVIPLERRKLAELEVIERLALAMGAEAFEAEVRHLSDLYTVDPNSTIQAISRLTHPSLIGMSNTPFHVFHRLSDELVMRAPVLLQRPSYRYRNGDNTAVPYELWLTIVRRAREYFDPAGLDADFLAARQREGLSSREAFDALIASKRRN